MARTNSYFPHDSNAKDDPKCVLLIEQLGMEGYGIYWMLVETLRERDNYRYPINLLSALARRHNTTHEKVRAVVCSYELFEIDGEEFFFSPSLIERMQPMEERKVINSKAGKASGESRRQKALQQKNEHTLNTCSTHVEHSLNRIDKNRIDKNIKKTTNVVKETANAAKKILSLTERQSIFQEELKPYVEKYGRDMIRAFYDYWSEPNQAVTKMRKELEKTWKTDSRLRTWERRSNNGK
ncbi:MAG: DUF4373 domain-containing protein [Phocaeicola sp.]